MNKLAGATASTSEKMDKSVNPPTEWPTDVDHGAETDLHRMLSTRHITMIALGSSIGMGLWLGSGTSLGNGGPAAIFIGYILSGTMIWAVSHSIGELAVMYPLPSAFTQWASMFVDPAAGFALGWGYWFYYWITIANELQGVVTVLNFWTDKLPIAAWITLMWLVIVFINVWAVRLFGEVEVASSSIKFGWIIVVIISLIVVSAGGAPNHDAIGFRYWNAYPFTKGFKGFLTVMPTCIFAMSGSENCALVAAETENPSKSVPKAVGSIWLRLSLFYILGSLVVTISVDPKDVNLFGASGVNASPFVIAYRNAGLEPLAHMMNAVIFISVVSTGSIAAYAGSRTLMGLAHLRKAPKIFGKADKVGRPVAGLVMTLIVGGGLAFLNVTNDSATIFTWFSSLTSLVTLFGWSMICLSHLRMRHAWKVQGRSVAELPWKSWTYPYGAIWALAWCIILIIVEFYLSLFPLGKPTTAKNFFANYITVVAMIVIYIGAKIYYRGPMWVDASTIDLDALRRFYTKPDEEAPREKGVKGNIKNVIGFLFN
ncbi:amino acid permease/ SLC12A domain-containing protein [Aspergillus avenaceus]|uniref:Amino acid permease/ SLC12A domain-containing protein n=1 Tax=Aspergillus avenaceus TaxID=36643 RepID=A0A5N6U454_ASPAV|nr:amino acid permease/ SLC12A domain-containing protein [Aspergillus avenaceus]